MKIHIAKLSYDYPINDFDSWSPEAVRNAIVVGLGRVLNDAVAGVAKSDNPATFHDRCLAKINTRVANLRNADVRGTKPAMTTDELIAQLTARGYVVEPRIESTGAAELAAMNTEALDAA